MFSGTGFTLNTTNLSLLSRLVAQDGANEVLSRVADLGLLFDQAIFEDIRHGLGVADGQTLFEDFVEAGIVVKGRRTILR